METKPVRFGIMADVHQDFMYKAEDRLRTFIEHMNRERVDFIIQLGDFCYPLPENRSFVNTWEQFEGPRYHVLGNHDMDKCSKRTIMDFIGMERCYYSFDSGDYHFVVLDGNNLFLEGRYIDYEFCNYHRHPEANNYLTPEQLEWLRGDLAATDKTTVIFSHQNLESSYTDVNYGVHNSEDFRSIVKESNRAAGFNKVIACMNGHNHLDGVKVIDDLYFIHINSMSYFWMGKPYQHTVYSEEISEQHPILTMCAPYEEPLYAIVTLEDGRIKIEGRETGFVSAAPLECGHSNSYGGHIVTARIADRVLKY